MSLDQPMHLKAHDIAAAADKVEFVIRSFAAPAIKDPRDRRLESWRSSLNQVRSLLADTAKVQIAMVGTTGAGKSTLLNAVLEHELLPTGVMEPCTAFVTTVASHPQQEWKLRISYLTRKEWESELEILKDALRSEAAEENGEDRGEANKFKRMAKLKLAAVFGRKKDDIPDGFDPRGGDLPYQVERVLSRTEPEDLTFGTFAELHGHIKSLVRGDSLVWPLIEQVRATGPISNLPAGLELVDLPGLNDPNRVRVETTRRFLSSAPHIWVVFNMKRGLTDDIHGILRERGLLRRLILAGNYSALALVGTHADDVDADNAESLGLSPEADFPEIYSEYRRQVRTKAREQVSDLVSDLRQPGDNETTLQRLLEVTKSIPIIPTSARAFLRIKGVTNARRDYGISDPVESGIPEVQQHLVRVASEGGPIARLREAGDRLGILCDEVEFFFRSPGSSASSAQRQQARAELNRALESFGEAVKAIHAHAQSQYSGYRQAFLQSLKPLVPEARKGVTHSTGRWGGIHHMTLKAIVSRNGCFVSPSTGRDHDFNDDVSSPLLNLLPVRWEHFFKDQIDRVVGDASTKLEAQSEALAAQIAMILRFGKGADDGDSGAEHLKWFHSKMEFLRDKCREVLAKQIRERRGRLTGDVYNTAQDQMRPAYRDTKEQSGPGMKARILHRVQSHALHISSPLHESIESDLTKGLGEVWLQLEINLQRLFEEVRDKASQIGANATTDLQSSDGGSSFSEALGFLHQVKASRASSHE